MENRDDGGDVGGCDCDGFEPATLVDMLSCWQSLSAFVLGCLFWLSVILRAFGVAASVAWSTLLFSWAAVFIGFVLVLAIAPGRDRAGGEDGEDV